jgi:hypothetical protein
MSLHIKSISRVLHVRVEPAICFDNIYIKSINYKKSDFTVGLFIFTKFSNQLQQLKLHQHEETIF